MSTKTDNLQMTLTRTETNKTNDVETTSSKMDILQTHSTITVNLGTKTVNLVTKTDNSPIINHQPSFISVETSDKCVNNKSEEKVPNHTKNNYLVMKQKSVTILN